MDRFNETGGYFSRDGMAKERGIKNLSKMNLCLISTDKQFLLDLLYDISRANDCFEVKFLKEARLGAYLAHCYYTNEASLGDAWARYTSHPKTWALIQDDEVSEQFKNYIRSY